MRVHEQAEDNRRRHGRIRCELVSCSLGRVLDVSASGVRVRGKGRPSIRVDDHVTMTLSCPAGEVVALLRCARLQRAGLFGFEAGLEFVQPTPELRRMLSFIAQTNSAAETIVSDTARAMKRRDAA